MNPTPFATGVPMPEAPAVVSSMPIECYHSGAGVSKSGLDLIHLSPAHYAMRRPRESTSAQLVGNLAHCALLEPEAFDQRYRVGPTVNRNTREWKDFVASLAADVTAIQAEQFETAWRQAKAMRALPAVERLLGRGWSELSAFWRDEKTGELCRCRPDYAAPVGDGAAFGLLDVKTFRRAEAHAFTRQVASMRYHVQDAYYSDGFAIAVGVPVAFFLFVVVEVDWPHAAACFILDEPSREQARLEYRRDLDLYAHCRAMNDWPSYSGDVQILSLPRYAFAHPDAED